MLHEQLKQLIGDHTEVACEPTHPTHARAHLQYLRARLSGRGGLMKRRFGLQHSGGKTIALTSRECGSAGGSAALHTVGHGAQVHCRGRFVRQHAAGILGHVCHNARTAAVAGNATRRVRTAAEDVAQTSDVVSRRRSTPLWAALPAALAVGWPGLPGAAALAGTAEQVIFAVLDEGTFANACALGLRVVHIPYWKSTTAVLPPPAASAACTQSHGRDTWTRWNAKH